MPSSSVFRRSSFVNRPSPPPWRARMHRKGSPPMSTIRLRLNTFYPFGLLFMSVLLLALVLPGAKQIGATGVAAIAAQPSDDDFFTRALGQPVNMSNPDDIDIWFTSVLGGLSNVTVNNNGNG